MLSDRLEVRYCRGVVYSGFLPPELWDQWTAACEHGCWAVFSYHTPIAWVLGEEVEGYRWVIPDVEYSPETSEHQHMVKIIAGDYYEPPGVFDKNLLG